ncbi:helix-turn-helix domain-containing protein [Streptomyces yaizuensis]|uniref:Helix-turn-helix domain-containing protein n=1 Tax=Streptomyces yaizuensis TaxID=2989713 RepID=A0ABQ5NQH9_9ACTN|nr:helix-turn-helix domain-containing protein [Streptomyces sp. YSPA8]GLF92639.1 helix-turn-helix domain-containing protein [Streptomyces sp. YSPA8]
MAQQGSGDWPDALTVLTLLAEEAPPARITALPAEARRGGAGEAELTVLEQATRLGLDVHAQRRERQQREAGLSALLDTARDLVVPHDLNGILKVITRRSRLLLGADMAYVSFPGPEDGVFHIRASDGHTSALNVGLRLAGDAGLGHAALASHAPAWTPDYLGDSRFNHSAAIDTVVRVEGLRAIMAVPLSHGPRPFGALYIADRNVRHYTREEISTASSLGELAGLAIERARLLDEARSAMESLYEEKSRVAEALGVLREHRRAHGELVEQALSDTGLSGLVTAAGRFLRGALRIHAADGTVLAAAGRIPGDEPAETGPAVMEAHSARRPVRTPDGLWAAPVTAGREVLGTLVLWPEQPSDEGTEELLRLVAQAVAVQLLGAGNPSAAQGRAHDELLEDLLAGPQRPPQQLVERARRLGVDLTTPHVVVVARPEARGHGRAVALVSGMAQRSNGLRAGHGGNVVLLLPGGDPGAAARAVLDELTPLLGEPVTVAGAGPVTDVASVYHSHQEALRCLDAMTVLGTAGRSASTRELGFLGVLLADNRDVRAFVDSVIGPVLDYDRQRGTELGRTLDVYFETGGSPTRAAQRLHVHPNTVARRLERVGELIGAGWQDPGQALEVQLALRLSRIRDVLLDDGPPPPG